MFKQPRISWVDGVRKSALITIGAGVMAVMATSGTASAQDPGAFAAWLDGLRRDATAEGIAAATLDSALSGLRPNDKVIELDRRQAEFTMTFQQYRDRVASPQRIAMGRRLMDEHRDILDAVGRTYGVQPRFIVALWGVESNFGANTGGYDVIEALATLAYDGRRSSYFRGELINALRIIDQGHIDRHSMTGSWAGALGQCQFMPSSFLSRAVDFDGDGRKDIWSSRSDVFGSAANYLARAGWRDDITWGRQVRLPRGFDKKLASLDVTKRISDWQALGVRRADGRDLPGRDLNASIILPDRGNGAAFMVYDNFRVLLRWNRSYFFALTVGHLADQLGAS